MAKRTISHEKETIACRAFENALSPSMVANRPQQGNDYGSDFDITAFENEKLVRKYQAQVKYLNKTKLREFTANSLVHIYNFHGDFPYDSSYISYSFSKSALKDCLQLLPQTKTLFTLANEEHVFFLWFDDYYLYFFKWLNSEVFDGPGHMSMYFSGIRSFRKTLYNEDLDTTRSVYPGMRYYSDLPEIFLAHVVRSKSQSWIDNSIDSGTVDSISNIGFALYFSAINKQIDLKNNFNAQGFWEHLISQFQSNNYVLLCFSNFIGYLNPTDEMIHWANSVLETSLDYYKVPVAFQILGNCTDCKVTENIVLQINPEYYIVQSFCKIVDIQNHTSRIEKEFFISLSVFLKKVIINAKSINAQELLIDFFYQFDHSIGYNVFTNIIVELIESNKLLNDGENYSNLIKYHECNINNKQQFIDKIYDIDRRHATAPR